MKPIRDFSVACGVMILAGCASHPSSPASWSALHVGMLKSDVRSQLGEPDAVLPQPIKPPQDPHEWCLTLSLWKIEGPVEQWVYSSSDGPSLIVDFDYAGKVMDGSRVVVQPAH